MLSSSASSLSSLAMRQLSPVYFFLRVLVSYPHLLLAASHLLLAAAPSAGHRLMCGVPYTALPLATLMSVEAGVGMVVRRKEAKEYGTKRIVEGVWEDGQNCLIVEDIVTTGGSVLDTAELLRGLGMEVTDCVVLLDRQQGGVENLGRGGVQVHSVVQLGRVLELLVENNRITGEMAEKVRQFVRENQVKKDDGDRPGEKQWERTRLFVCLCWDK